MSKKILSITLILTLTFSTLVTPVMALPYKDSVDRPPLHRIWNEGIDTARHLLNSDFSTLSGFLHSLSICQVQENLGILAYKKVIYPF